MELKIVILFVVAVTTAFPQVPLQPGQFFQPGISPIQPLSPQQPLISAQNSEEKLCGVLVFASKKCPSGSNKCKRCVIDKLALDCPYPSSEDVDCSKQKSCALATQFNCPDV